MIFLGVAKRATRGGSMAFGLDFKAERNRRGLTQVQAAKQLGWYEQTVVDMEKDLIPVSRSGFRELVNRLDSGTTRQEAA